MTKLWIPALAIAVALLSAGAARAAADCAMPHFLWELELDTLELLAGPGDVAAERAALGETAELRGDTRQDAYPSDTASVDLGGTGDADWFYGFESEP